MCYHCVDQYFCYLRPSEKFFINILPIPFNTEAIKYILQLNQIILNQKSSSNSCVYLNKRVGVFRTLNASGI